MGESIPYGWRKDYQPSATVTPYEVQYSFTYTSAGSTVALSYPSGTQQELTVLGYDANTDVLSVDWEGYTQTWVGCDSGQMPAVALAACP